jgi:hypothetical protein
MIDIVLSLCYIARIFRLLFDMSLCLFLSTLILLYIIYIYIYILPLSGIDVISEILLSVSMELQVSSDT